MLEEDERVTDLLGFTSGDNFGLDAEPFGVGNAAEMEEMDVHFEGEID
jgi:hypothetical protein